MRKVAREEALTIETTRYALAVNAGLDRQRAESAARIGIALTSRGEKDLGHRRLREAVAIFEQLGAWAEAGDAQSRLARLNRIDGDYLAALADEQIALSLRRRIDPPPNVWRSLLNLAVLYEQLELPDDARRRYAESLDEAEREGTEASIAVVLTSFSGFLNDFGTKEAAQALAMAERAFAIVNRQDDLVQMSSALLQIGRAQINLNHLEAAEQALAAALGHASKADHRSMQAHIQLRYAELALLKSESQEALKRADAARLLYEELGNKHRLVKVHAALEQIYAAMGDKLNAARAGRERFRLRDELIGSQATGKLGELLGRFELSEERLRSERLVQEKAVAELKLAAERQQLRTSYLVALAIAIALALLAWRHVTARRLYRLLRAQNRVVSAQAEQLTQANRQLIEQTERLYQVSITDALTGIFNRARGMQGLGEVMAASSADARPAVILIDIDHFKAINDTHGHPVGDQVLIAVARALQQAIPSTAELSRVGGEEFMVVLPDPNGPRAVDIGNALRAQVRAAIVDVGGIRLNVTISLGVCAIVDLEGASAQSAYALADQALYRAKRSGRHSV